MPRSRNPRASWGRAKTFKGLLSTEADSASAPAPDVDSASVIAIATEEVGIQTFYVVTSEAETQTADTNETGTQAYVATDVESKDDDDATQSVPASRSFWKRIEAANVIAAAAEGAAGASEADEGASSPRGRNPSARLLIADEAAAEASATCAPAGKVRLTPADVDPGAISTVAPVAVGNCASAALQIAAIRLPAPASPTMLHRHTLPRSPSRPLPAARNLFDGAMGAMREQRPHPSRPMAVGTLAAITLIAAAAALLGRTGSTLQPPPVRAHYRPPQTTPLRNANFGQALTSKGHTKGMHRVVIGAASTVAYTAAVLAVAPHFHAAIRVCSVAQAAHVPASVARSVALAGRQLIRGADVSRVPMAARRAVTAVAISRVLQSVVNALRRLSAEPTGSLTPPPPGWLHAVTSRLPPLPKVVSGGAAGVLTVLALWA